jgi:hypothetical protein
MFATTTRQRRRRRREWWWRRRRSVVGPTAQHAAVLLASFDAWRVSVVGSRWILSAPLPSLRVRVGVPAFLCRIPCSFPSSSDAAALVSLEAKKARAARFGITDKDVEQHELNKKIEERKKRFGLVRSGRSQRGAGWCWCWCGCRCLCGAIAGAGAGAGLGAAGGAAGAAGVVGIMGAVGGVGVLLMRCWRSEVVKVVGRCRTSSIPASQTTCAVQPHKPSHSRRHHDFASCAKLQLLVRLLPDSLLRGCGWWRCPRSRNR